MSFTGRDEEITDERRQAQRYTLSHLAHDVKNQTGLGEPIRDWFPISFTATFGDRANLVHGAAADFGQLSCGRHPNCGVGMAVMIDKDTKEVVPVTAFLKADQMAKDVAKADRPRRARAVPLGDGHGARAHEELRPVQGADPFQELTDLMKKFDKTFGATGRSYGKVTGDRTMADIEKRRTDRWNFSSSPECGSRISSTTTSAARSATSFPTRRRKGRLALRL